MNRGVALLSLVLAQGCSESFERGDDLAITATPTQLAFPDVPVGDEQYVDVILKHVGETGRLLLQPATIDGSDDLTVSGPDLLTLDPGETAAVRVTYAPIDADHDEAVVTIAHNVPDIDPVRIPISTVQQRPRLTALPGSVQFGNVDAGTATTQSVLIRNTGTLDTTVEQVGLDLTFGAPFALISVPDLPRPLPIGDEFTPELEYAPAHTGFDATHHGKVRFTTDHEATNNRVVPLNGAARHAQLVVTPAIVDFGWLAPGDQKSADVDIVNAGQDPVTFSALGLETPAPGLALLGAPSAPFVLKPGEGLPLTLTFAPPDVIAAADARIGTLAMVTDDFVTPSRDVPVFGRAAEPTLRFVPEGLADFGIVAIGYQHTRTVLVINDGDAPLTLEGLGTTGEPGFEVLSAPALPVVLSGDEGTAEIVVGYLNPGVSETQVWGQLVVHSDDPANPEAVLDLRALTEEAPHCRPRYAPELVEFGVVAPGSEAEQTFHLLNDGSMPCTWQGGALLDCATPTGVCAPTAGTSMHFRMGESPPPGRLVFFGDSLELTAIFEPQAVQGELGALAVATLFEGPGEGPIMFHHSPLGGVPPNLHGTVGTAGIVTDPDQVTFPLVTVGCGSEPTTVDVMRLGSQPIQWAEIDLSDCAGQVQALTPELPAPLFETAEGAVPLQLQLAPTEPGFIECTVLLHPDHPEAGSASVEVLGVGTTSPDRTDYFQQAIQFEADILFVVDDSGSMEDEQAALVDGFDGFIAKASQWEVNYHVGVVTPDVAKAGALEVDPVPFVDPTNWPFFAELASVGIDGSGDEKGLTTAWMAFQPSMVSPLGTNAGFLRNDALLAIVWVSDEDDHSDAPVGSYLEFFQTLKPEGTVRGYAIVGDPSWTSESGGGCGGGLESGGVWGPQQGAFPGDRYVEAAEKMGGSWFSICEFGAETGTPILEQIGEDAFQPVHVFPLSEPAIAETITVLVNDLPCEDGWAYDEAQNAVIFDLEGGPCFPGPGAEVTVNYEPLCFEFLADPSM